MRECRETGLIDSTEMNNGRYRRSMRDLRLWPYSARRARAHAFVAATVLWAAVIVIFVAGRGERSIAGPIKGSDFLQFYTMGSLARTHNTAALYDFDGFHQAQVALVPESSPELYPPVYPPQAALLFAPFSRLAFRPALLLWTLTTIVVYAVIVRSAWRPVAAALPDTSLVIAGAAAFPPVYYLVQYGQGTILILTAFWAGWIALERKQSFLAGMAFGLLLIKPQLALPLAIVVLACREWALLAGALTAIAVQVAIVALVLGAPVVQAYIAFIPSIIANAEVLEPKPFMSHSIRAVTRLAPNWVGVPLWIALSTVVLTYVVSVWRSQAPVRVRVGMVIVASVLVSPHLIIYDAAILALPLIWFAAYVKERSDRIDRAIFGAAVYWLFVMLLVPSATAVGVQLSVPIMVWLTLHTARMVQPPIRACL
jgi:Glycosyltransferase family 87